jgi:hypothetical protein
MQTFASELVTLVTIKIVEKTIVKSWRKYQEIRLKFNCSIKKIWDKNLYGTAPLILTLKNV